MCTYPRHSRNPQAPSAHPLLGTQHLWVIVIPAPASETNVPSSPPDNFIFPRLRIRTTNPSRPTPKSLTRPPVSSARPRASPTHKAPEAPDALHHLPPPPRAAPGTPPAKRENHRPLAHSPLARSRTTHRNSNSNHSTLPPRHPRPLPPTTPRHHSGTTTHRHRHPPPTTNHQPPTTNHLHPAFDKKHQVDF
jgi:hypothetical protein